MKPNSRRLLNIQKEHHRRVRPEAKVLNLHMQKKRKKKILQWPPVEIIWWLMSDWFSGFSHYIIICIIIIIKSCKRRCFKDV